MFSTTRQSQAQGILLDEHKPQFAAQDEDRKEPAFVLEVMNPDGTDVHQPTDIFDRAVSLGAGARADLEVQTPTDGTAVRIQL